MSGRRVALLMVAFRGRHTADTSFREDISSIDRLGTFDFPAEWVEWMREDSGNEDDDGGVLGSSGRWRSFRCHRRMCFEFE